jgi:hypothetical protein
MTLGELALGREHVNRIDAIIHGLGPVGLSEAFALRLHELTGCGRANRDR